MQQPMQNPDDSSDPTTAMNMALALLAKSFKVNTIPTNNNQRSSLIPCNSQIAQQGINTSQDIKMQMVDDNVGNHVRHNAVQNDGNEVGQNAVKNPGIQIVENMNGLSVVLEIANQYGNRNVGTTLVEGNVKSRKRDAAYLQQQLQIAQEEEAGIQSTQKEFEFMTTIDAYEETERVKLQAQLGDLKDKSSDTQCASNTLDLVSQKLKDENVSLEFQVLNYAKENAHLKTAYKNLFDSIKVTQAETNSIIDSLQKQLYDTIYENAKLRAQLFDKVSEQRGTTKVDKTNALSKPVTSNSTPSIRESKAVQTVNVIAPRIFRTNPSKTSKQQANSDLNGFSSTRVNNTAKTRRPHPRSNSNTDRVPFKSKSSCLSNNVEKIEENHRNS
ncbi:hypothetical protein Tco_0096954 [Tanacetum coccineum]